TLFHASQASWGGESHFDGKPGRVTDGPWIERLPGSALCMLWSTFDKDSAYSVGSAISSSGSITGPWEVQQDRVYTRDGGHGMVFTAFDGRKVLALHEPNKRPNERAKLFEVTCNDFGIAVLNRLDAAATTPARGIPSPEQLAWHEMEMQMFLCLDPCTWQGREYDDHSTPLATIDPAQLDTDQWCEAAKSFGAKQILFVAKHTGGFCWWPTQTTEYCVRNIAWKNGQGDVLGELAESCRRHGLKLGIYIYPGDDQWGAGIGSGGKTSDPAKQGADTAVLRQQWTEVLTNYGEIAELWFDGSCVVELGDIIRQHAPKAMVFQGPHATLRWPGNEKGIAPDPAWQTVLKSDAATGVATGAHSNPDGDVWLPMEMDTTLLDHKWFWAPETDHMIKSLDTLMDIYCKSVGRGCVLLLNATPDTTGRIPESHMARYREFGAAIATVYKDPIAETSGTGRDFQLDFDMPARVSHVVLQEDIRRGHTVRGFRIEGLLPSGEWKVLARAASVGYKRIESFDPLELSGLRLRITDSVGEPHINSFAAFGSGFKATAVNGASGAWQKIESWEAIQPASDWQTVEVDLTQAIRLPGEYHIEIRPQDDSAIPETKDAVPLIAGTEAQRLLTQGHAPNTWILQRTDMVTDDAKGVTALRLRIRCLSSASCASELWVGTGTAQ
ncbi:MAG: alpha-L-fucosidase, partial [Candidatus Hydrogenedentes bacterium]|nr:alpha-L-fucosidase [Candidatus Hydrogenedentota bacterium]